MGADAAADVILTALFTLFFHSLIRFVPLASLNPNYWQQKATGEESGSLNVPRSARFQGVSAGQLTRLARLIIHTVAAATSFASSPEK